MGLLSQHPFHLHGVSFLRPSFLFPLIPKPHPHSTHSTSSEAQTPRHTTTPTPSVTTSCLPALDRTTWLFGSSPITRVRGFCTGEYFLFSLNLPSNLLSAFIFFLVGSHFDSHLVEYVQITLRDYIWNILPQWNGYPFHWRCWGHTWNPWGTSDCVLDISSFPRQTHTKTTAHIQCHLRSRPHNIQLHQTRPSQHHVYWFWIGQHDYSVVTDNAGPWFLQK